MPGRHFHFTFELADPTFVDNLPDGLVESILRHAGLSAADAAEAAGRALSAVGGAGSAVPSRLQIDAGVDQVEVVVSHAGRPAWSTTLPVE